MDIHQKDRILVTCFDGLAPFLQKELEDLGCEIVSAHDTGVETTGSLADAMRLCLRLRTALNVMLLLTRFRARNADELYAGVKAVPWEEIIPADEYVSVVASVDTPAINNTMYAGMRVKDAVVDRIAAATGRRPDAGPERDNVVLQLYWKRNLCWLYLNASGVKLSDRGYRKMPHKAPLRETLAAGLILATGYDGQTPLVAPMCGSGTLAIEAALIGLGRAPGLLRGNFGFMHVAGFDARLWSGMRAEARKLGRRGLPAPIIASDIDPAAIAAARQNALTAGVDHLIRFHVCDFADTPVPPGPGVVVLNPEYGERMGTQQELEATYARIGDFFKQRCSGYAAHVFTGNMDLAKRIGLRASRRTRFFNAKIECRLFRYEMYEGTRKKRRGKEAGADSAETPSGAEEGRR